LLQGEIQDLSRSPHSIINLQASQHAVFLHAKYSSYLRICGGVGGRLAGWLLARGPSRCLQASPINQGRAS